MEFKVYVDGIQRVVCGVSLDTTCQDIVIALAHATGRTGRFSLIEKWRKTERAIPPGELPLRLLQKWGEYGSDVQFLLVQNDPAKILPDKMRILPDNKPNYTKQMSKSDNSVKRSSTFTGIQSVPPRAMKHLQKVKTLQENSLSENSVSEDSFDRLPSPILPDSPAVPGYPAHNLIQGRVQQLKNSDHYQHFNNDVSQLNNNNNNNTGRLPLSKSYDSLERTKVRKLSPRRVSTAKKYTGNRISDIADAQESGMHKLSEDFPDSTQYKNNKPPDNHRRTDTSSPTKFRSGDVLSGVSQFRTDNNSPRQFPVNSSRSPHLQPDISQSNYSQDIYRSHFKPDISSSFKPDTSTQSHFKPDIPPSSYKKSETRSSNIRTDNTRSPTVRTDNSPTPRSPQMHPDAKQSSQFQSNISRSPKFDASNARSPQFKPETPRSPLVQSDVPNSPHTPTSAQTPSYVQPPWSNHRVDPAKTSEGRNAWDVVEVNREKHNGAQGHQKPIGNGHLPNHTPRPPKITEEYVSLVRLVVSQQERLMTQSDKLSTIDSDLSNAEETHKENSEKLENLANQIDQLERTFSKNDVEISKIDSENLDTEKGNEEKIEKDLNTELTEGKTRLEACEKKLEDSKIKIKFFSQRLELERAKIEKIEKSTEISSSTKNLKSDPVLDDLNNEVTSLETKLLQRQKELRNLELDLKEANMMDFAINAPQPEREVDEQGVFKQLLRPASTNPTKRGEENSTTVITPPDGVWV